LVETFLTGTAEFAAFGSSASPATGARPLTRAWPQRRRLIYWRRLSRISKRNPSAGSPIILVIRLSLFYRPTGAATYTAEAISACLHVLILRDYGPRTTQQGPGIESFNRRGKKVVNDRPTLGQSKQYSLAADVDSSSCHEL